MFIFFFFKQKTAYEMRISDWSSDVCSSDLLAADRQRPRDAEIVDVGIAARVEQDVGRLEVAMHHALGMGRGQALGDLPRQAQRKIGRASCRERVCQYV